MRAFVTRQLPEAILAPLRACAEVEVWPNADQAVPRQELLRQARAADGLLVMLTDRVDAELLAAAPRLRAVSTMSVGTDHIELAACQQRGIVLGYTPDVLTETTADLCFALLLATARRVVEGQRAILAGSWSDWAPFFLAGQDVYGKTIGIVGLGRIGQAVARRARGFGMRILYTGPREKPEAEALGAAFRSLDELLAASDFVVLLAPLLPGTRHLIGASELARMQPGAILINAGRGALVDEQALRAALESGTIWGAGLDVFEREPIGPEHPLLRYPRVVALPHLGSATMASRTAMAALAVENLALALSGKPVRFSPHPQG